MHRLRVGPNAGRTIKRRSPRRRTLTPLALVVIVLLSSFWTIWPVAPSQAAQLSQEGTVDPVMIPLTGPVSSSRAEISGLAWYGDWLVLLPQFPWFNGTESALYVLSKGEIVDFLDGRSAGPLTPRPLPLEASGVAVEIPGFEGFESIAFWGDEVFATVEADPNGQMQGWLLRGRMEPDLSVLRLDVGSRVAIDPQASFNNMSDEALVVQGTPNGPVVLTFYEANGRLANRAPLAHRFDASLQPLEPLPLPYIEYRITDATALDAENRFWISNYFWPGEVQVLLGQFAMASSLRAILTGATLRPVERLVELQLGEDGIQFTDTPPINLTLGQGDSRNWEGIVRLDSRGFLLATDRFPQTLLAFVPNVRQ